MYNPVASDPLLLTSGRPANEIVTGIAHPARMYDYYLGGKDNYEVDRDAAEQILAGFPRLREIARANRAFQQRAVRTIVAEHGIRQLLDIGTGIPTQPNTHEIAQAIAPDTRVVYIDNDPIVIAHAQARLTGSGTRTTAIIEADLRAPRNIVTHPTLHGLLDLDQPVGLLLLSVVHFLPDTDCPYEIVERLMKSLAPGSCLALSHATADGETERATQAATIYQDTQSPVTLRSKREIAAFFDGLDVLEPGIVKQPWWRPDETAAEDMSLNWGYCGIGTKPSAA